MSKTKTPKSPLATSPFAAPKVESIAKPAKPSQVSVGMPPLASPNPQITTLGEAKLAAQAVADHTGHVIGIVDLHNDPTNPSYFLVHENFTLENAGLVYTEVFGHGGMFAGTEYAIANYLDQAPLQVQNQEDLKDHIISYTVPHTKLA